MPRHAAPRDRQAYIYTKVSDAAAEKLEAEAAARGMTAYQYLRVIVLTALYSQGRA